MRPRSLYCCALVCVLALAATGCASGPGSPGVAASQIPHLRPQGTATQLIVDGKPFVVLSGETEEETSTSLENMRPVWPTLVKMNLNTVLPVVYWGLFEPEEGKFDFTLVDGLLQEARNHNLRVGLVWFASWKNGLSIYAPTWVKKTSSGFRAPKTRSGAASGDLLLHRRLRRCHAGRGCACLCRPDAAHQGSGRPAAHRHHGPGGERSGHGGGYPRPLPGGR